MFRLEHSNRSRISGRPRRKTKQKNDQCKHRPHAPVRIQRLPTIHQRRMAEAPRKDQQQSSPQHPAIPKKISPDSEQPHRERNSAHGNRNPPMQTAGQTIKDVPAIQLPSREQIQRRNKKSDPSRASNRMQKNISRTSVRAQNRNQQSHQRRISESKPRWNDRAHAGNDLRIRDRKNQRRNGENESDNRTREPHIKKRFARRNRRANPNERAESPKNCRRWNEIRIGGVDSIFAASEVMPKLMREKDAKQREREGNPKHQQL